MSLTFCSENVGGPPASCGCLCAPSVPISLFFISRSTVAGALDMGVGVYANLLVSAPLSPLKAAARAQFLHGSKSSFISSDLSCLKSSRASHTSHSMYPSSRASFVIFDETSANFGTLALLGISVFPSRLQKFPSFALSGCLACVPRAIRKRRASGGRREGPLPFHFCRPALQAIFHPISCRLVTTIQKCGCCSPPAHFVPRAPLPGAPQLRPLVQATPPSLACSVVFLFIGGAKNPLARHLSVVHVLVLLIFPAGWPGLDRLAGQTKPAAPFSPVCLSWSAVARRRPVVTGLRRSPPSIPASPGDPAH